MKNSISKISIAILVFAFISCSDFLQENPQSNYYLSNLGDAQLEPLLVGMYEPLSRSRGRLWESTYSTNLELCGEYGFTLDPLFTSVAKYEFNIINSTTETWTTFYQTIGRANFILDELKTNTLASKAKKEAAIGEASFVRALCYYNLLRTYGKVPLRLIPVKDGNSTGQPLAEITELYNQVIADLNVARKYLPVTVTAARAGRATKGAALTMLADQYLTQGDYTNAKKFAKIVIDSSTFFGYKLEPSLDVIYSPTIKSNTEDIFSIKFASITSYGNFLPAVAHDDRAKDAGFAARGLRRLTTKKTVPFIQGWSTKDPRRKYNLYDSLVIRGVKLKANLRTGEDFFYGKYKDPNAPAENGAGNSFYLYRYADVLLIFAEAENKLNGPTSDAYTAINQVRRRGYGLPINTASALADITGGLSQSDFDDLIFRERGYEFFFEAKRWFDLKRTNRINAFAQAAGKTAPAAQYWPIPDVELANNPALK